NAWRTAAGSRSPRGNQKPRRTRPQPTLDCGSHGCSPPSHLRVRGSRIMTIGMLSSTLFGDMFGTAAMRAAFGELAFLARCAEVEAALARAQARAGIVPTDAAAAISQAAASVIEQPQ